MSSYRVCSKCNTVYNHQIGYCFVDGEELVLSNALQVPQDVPRPITQDPIENTNPIDQTPTVDHTDVVPKNQQNTFEKELNLQEAKTNFSNGMENPVQIDDEEDDISLSLLMEDSDTTVSDGTLDNIELHQPSISQEISLDLPPLNQELAQNSDIHFDDTTDIFSSSNANINLEQLDSTQPIFSTENAISQNVSVQNSILQNVKIEHNIIDGIERNQFRQEQLRYDDHDDIRQGEIGIDELMGLQHQKKQRLSNSESQGQWGDFSDEGLPTEELPLPKVQDFSLQNGDDLLIEEEDEITNFETAPVVNNLSSPNSSHPSTSSPNVQVPQSAFPAPEGPTPQPQMVKNPIPNVQNPKSESASPVPYSGISSTKTSTSQEISSSHHFTPPTKTTNLSPYIIGFILFPLGLFIGSLGSNNLTNDDSKTDGETIAITTQNKTPSEAERDVNSQGRFDVVSTTKTQVKVEVSPKDNSSETPNNTREGEEMDVVGSREDINKEDINKEDINKEELDKEDISKKEIGAEIDGGSNISKSELVDGNNNEFIDIEIQLDDGLLSDGSEDLVQIYTESCKEGDIFWEGREISHVMQFPAGDNKWCVSYNNNEWLIDTSVHSTGILLISASSQPVFK